MERRLPSLRLLSGRSTDTPYCEADTVQNDETPSNMLNLKIFKKSRIIFWKYCEDSLILRAKPIKISLKLVINL